MKKVLYIAIAVAVVVAIFVAGGVYVNYQKNHPDSSYDRIPRALREEMLENWPADRFGKRFLDGDLTHYYGTHGDCVAFYCACEVGKTIAFWPCKFEVAGSRFAYPQSFEIIVYRDGEFIYLSEAYHRGWLNRWQIASIAQYHRQRLIDKFGEENIGDLYE